MYRILFYFISREGMKKQGEKNTHTKTSPYAKLPINHLSISLTCLLFMYICVCIYIYIVVSILFCLIHPSK